MLDRDEIKDLPTAVHPGGTVATGGTNGGDGGDGGGDEGSSSAVIDVS